MRQRLEASLRHILAEAADVLELAPSILNGFFGRLNTAAIPPLIFGAYFELVLALEQSDWTGAKRLLLEIATADNHPGGPIVTDFATGGVTDRYRRLVNTDPGRPVEILPPPAELTLRGRELIVEAFALLERGDPALAHEIRNLLREIVLAVGPASAGTITFDGASSFMLWGAIVLNAREHSTRLDMVQALAHESGHNLLFGLSADGPLVENDEDARYPSPLREDQRPMDGVVHAIFVTARMHRAVKQLARSNLLSPYETEHARRELARHAENFNSGLRIVDQDAELTQLGRRVIGDARQYMACRRV
jgi:hypothetical protein